MKTALLLLLILALPACRQTSFPETVYESETIVIEQIADGVYKHISLLRIPDYGTFPCNGLVYEHDGRAVVIDTPVDSTTSAELIDWIVGRDAVVTGVIPTHFHVDCLGGLDAFHGRSISSWANVQTIDLAKANGKVVPNHRFDSTTDLDPVLGLPIIVDPVGPGHTVDNIVVYLPERRVLFGGCLVKEIGAGYGNLADADTLEWSRTIERVMDRYGDAKIVVPGHGEEGGGELLEYTRGMFEAR